MVSSRYDNSTARLRRRDIRDEVIVEGLGRRCRLSRVKNIPADYARIGPLRIKHLQKEAEKSGMIVSAILIMQFRAQMPVACVNDFRNYCKL